MSCQVYLAGPMRGYDQFNFPAFDAAAEDLRQRGWGVVSPAEEDRRAGFDETKDSIEDLDLKAAIRRDVDMLMEVEGVAFLPGWPFSKGAQFELHLAKFLGKRIFFYPHMTELDYE